MQCFGEGRVYILLEVSLEPLYAHIIYSNYKDHFFLLTLSIPLLQLRAH